MTDNDASCAYMRDYTHKGQSRTICAFYVSSMKGTDRIVSASPDEPLGDVMNRIYPEGMPSEPVLLMIGAVPDILE